VQRRRSRLSWESLGRGERFADRDHSDKRRFIVCSVSRSAIQWKRPPRRADRAPGGVPAKRVVRAGASFAWRRSAPAYILRLSSVSAPEGRSLLARGVSPWILTPTHHIAPKGRQFIPRG